MAFNSSRLLPPCNSFRCWHHKRHIM
jgi:hypothetical protein